MKHIKKIVYLLALLFCFAGCKKQQVTQLLAVTRISFSNNTKLQAGAYVKFSNKKYTAGELIPTAYGDNKVEVYDNGTGEKIIDTVLHVTGPQNFFIYQPFDIVVPVIVSELPTTPPIDPRNPLKNEAPAPDGYVKIKLAFKSQFILPNQSTDLLVFSVTAASPTIPVAIETIHGVGSDYITALFQFKRPILSDGSLAKDFTFGLINPSTGLPFKNGAGTSFNGGAITLPVGTKNLYMFYIEDILGSSRSASVGIALNGNYYVARSTMVWSIQ